MLKEERQEMILDYIKLYGSVKTAELTKSFNTTRQTIHNDLDILSEKGKLKRVHGGAVRISKSEEPSIEARRNSNLTDKTIIGQVAASFVNERDTIFLDVSTTVNEMIPHLLAYEHLTIVTYSLEAAYLLSKQTTFDIIMIGGRMRNRDLATEGTQTLQSLRNIFVDKCFLGAGGVSMVAGITDYHFSDSEIRKIMIQNATEAYILFDSSKINTITISKYVDFDTVHQLISYDIRDTDFLNFLNENQIPFIDAKNNLRS
ncbi:DeoR/GlpR family DNA-binding transcription regulator [Jeotgalibaca sp. A122]|uniref:DeoR/GlpR family DNA-binding transcription regulator n=1 Tax=Jeotgalibaca sp. A122 TaxID=3457322 RepID=UPI003FD39DE9